MRINVAKLLADRPISARADRVVGIYVGVASVLYMLAYAADVAFAVDFWQGGRYSRLPFGDRDYRPLWLKIVVVLAFPVVFPLIPNAMLALELGIGDSWRAWVAEKKGLQLAVGSGPFLPVVAAGLTYYLNRDPNSNTVARHRFGMTEERNRHLVDTLGGSTLGSGPLRLRHCRVEADVGGVGVELALRRDEFADRFFFMAWPFATMSIGAHLGLLLFSYRPLTTFASAAPVFAMARLLVALLGRCTNVRDVSLFGAGIVSLFGALLVVGLVNEAWHNVGGVARFFGDGGTRVSFLLAMWCWKLLLFSVPEAVVTAPRVTKSIVTRQKMEDNCASWALFLFLLPVTVTGTMVFLEVTQVTCVFEALLPLPDTTAFTVLWARFLYEAPSVEDRARRLMHLLKCRMTAAVYDAVEQRNAPWRHTSSAFTEKRMDEVLLNAVVLNRDATQNVHSWYYASALPHLHYLPLLHEMTCDARVWLAMRQVAAAQVDAGRHTVHPPDAARLAWDEPQTFWQRRSLVRRLTGRSDAAYPQPADRLDALQGQPSAIMRPILYFAIYARLALQVLRALSLAVLFVFVAKFLFSVDSDEGFRLQFMALFGIMAGVAVALAALPAAWVFSDSANTRAPPARWSRATLGDLSLWIAAYLSPPVDELIAGALTFPRQVLPYDVLPDIAAFLSPSDIRQHSMSFASQIQLRDAALSAGYCRLRNDDTRQLPAGPGNTTALGADATAEDYADASALFGFGSCVPAMLAKSFVIDGGDANRKLAVAAWNRHVAVAIADGVDLATQRRALLFEESGRRTVGLSLDPPPCNLPTRSLRVTGGVGPVGEYDDVLSAIFMQRLNAAIGLADTGAIRDLWEWQIASYIDFIAGQTCGSSKRNT